MNTARRTFISSIEVKKTFEAAGRRSSVSTNLLVHLTVPSGSPMFALNVVDALLTHTRGLINRRLIIRFNNSPVGREAANEAKAEFVRQVLMRAADPPYSGALTIDDVAWLTGVTRSAVTSWRDRQIIPVSTSGEVQTIQPRDLLDRCRWVMPSR